MPSTTGSNRRRYAVHTRADENKWRPAPGTRKRAHNPTWCSKQVEAPGELHWSTSVPASCATMASDINRLHALMENKGCHRKALRSQARNKHHVPHDTFPNASSRSNQFANVGLFYASLDHNNVHNHSGRSMGCPLAGINAILRISTATAIAYIFTWPACASNV